MRLLKINLLIGVILSVSACYYDFTSRCLVLPQSVHCAVKKQSDIEIYSKNVSYEQKLQDIEKCLGSDSENIPNKRGSIFGELRKKYPYSNDGEKKIIVFDTCMKNKGYLFKEPSRR